MIYLKIIILAILQGACELLPVSSSAHVIIAEELMGINPVTPAMTLLLVMLHTGTMFAVILYFRRAWKESYFKSRETFRSFAFLVVVATFVTGTIGLVLKEIIEKVFLRGTPHAQVEMIFGNLGLIGISLAVVGILIIFSGRREKGLRLQSDVGLRESAWIGAVQALCLPFRGVFPLRRHYFNGPFGRRHEKASRRIQLRAGSRAYPSGSNKRGVSAARSTQLGVPGGFGHL